MGLFPFLPAAPSFAQSGTLYVTRNGNDANNGLGWQTAFATIQAAVNAATAVGGVQMPAIELGPGTFTITSPIVISSTQVPQITGNGSGQVYDPTNNQLTPQHPTIIANTGTGDALQITGPANFGSGGSVTNTGTVISNLAITGNASSVYGVNVTRTEAITLRNVVLSGHGSFGLRLSKVFGLTLDNSSIYQNGVASAAVPSGGIFLDNTLGPNVGLVVRGTSVNFNAGYNFYDPATNSTDCGFSDSTFQGATATALAGSGIGFHGAGQYSFRNVDFEANALYDCDTAGGLWDFGGCTFYGDTTSTYGLNIASAGGSIINLNGCKFAGHTGAPSLAVNNPGNNFINWSGCVCTDTNFINGGTLGGTVPAEMANAKGTNGTIITSGAPQTLNANGAVVFDPSFGVNQWTLNANITSSTIATAPNLSTIIIVLIQGAGGNHTISPPAGVKWLGGAAPTWSVTAGFRDIVELYWDGTSWSAVSQNIGVH